LDRVESAVAGAVDAAPDREIEDHEEMVDELFEPLIGRLQLRSGAPDSQRGARFAHFLFRPGVDAGVAIEVG